MTLRLNGTTSGYAEIDAPAIAGSNTLLLPGSNGSAYQFLRNGATAGTTEFAGSITSGTAVASTSGTSIDFTGIPSYVKRITVMFAGVSTNGASFKRVQIGTSGGIETTGYLGSDSQNAIPATTTGGFDIASNAAPDVLHGAMMLMNISGNTWVCVLMTGKSDYGTIHTGGFSKPLAGTLDRVRITTVNGTDTFDAGSINILYEG